MLPALRDGRGRPSWRVRALALVLALLLAGPLTALAARAVIGAISSLY